MLAPDWAQKNRQAFEYVVDWFVVVLSPGLSQPLGRRIELFLNERNFTVNRFPRVECR